LNLINYVKAMALYISTLHLNGMVEWLIKTPSMDLLFCLLHLKWIGLGQTIAKDSI